MSTSGETDLVIDYLDPQRHYGLMRACELMAIAMVARDVGAEAYVSIGSGTGWDFAALRDRYACGMAMLGFDWSQPLPQNSCVGLEVCPGTIFEPSAAFDALASEGQHFTAYVHGKISAFAGRFAGPVLYYTDNGCKKCELRELLRWAKPGDVFGTHDYGDSRSSLTRGGTGIEVHERDCGFLSGAGFSEVASIQPWLEEQRCSQNFWAKGARP